MGFMSTSGHPNKLQLTAAPSPLYQISAVRRLSGLADVIRPNPLLHNSEKFAKTVPAMLANVPPT